MAKLTDAQAEVVKGSRSFASLATLRKDGSPHITPIWVDYDGENVVINTAQGRAKTSHIRRDPRVSIHVTADDFWSYVVLEGDAELTPVAASTDDATVDELVEYYRALNGEHPDWDDYRRAMVTDRRLVLRLRPTHAYGMTP